MALDLHETRVSEWLEKQGYASSRPTFLPEGSRNPDFWAESATHDPAALWVEVKSIEDNDTKLALDMAHPIVSAAKVPEGLGGHGTVDVEGHAVEQSVRWVVRKFNATVAQYAGQKIKLGFVQQTRDGVGVRRLEVGGAEPTVIWVRGAGKRPISVPGTLCEDSFAPATVFREDDSPPSSGLTYNFCEWNEPRECSLVAHLDPARGKFTFATMSGGSSQVRARAINALEDANSQLKAGCAERPAPSIVVLVPKGPFADDHQIQMACYGLWTVPISFTANGAQQGDTYCGVDGIFRKDKNRHISAAVLLRADGPATYFPNPFAHRPLEESAAILRDVQRTNIEFT